MVRFRNDIAGLRAVAVLPILFYHAGVTNFLPGGFAGVDVFFVISGYLITALIMRDLEAGTFSLRAFYRRRIVRILPMLVVVILTTLAVGSYFLLPLEMTLLVESAAAAVFSVANIYFFATTDYFAQAAHERPLLHSWSLSLEEQFYIIVPPLIYLLHRWRRRAITGVIAALSGLSFVLCALWQYAWPASGTEAAFYLLPARAWELGLGAMLALGMAPDIRSARLRNLLAFLGAVLLLVSFLAVHNGPLFPMPLALPATLGTGLIIAYGEQTVVGRLLSVKPMLMIGAISYALYLWHWPIITLYRLETGYALTWVETIALVAVSVAIASASYRWIERPLLRRYRDTGTVAHWRVFAAGGVAVAVILGVAAGAGHMAGKMRGLPPAAAQAAQMLAYPDTEEAVYQTRRGVCFVTGGATTAFDPQCTTPDPLRENWLVLGDSHAAHLWRALAEAHPEINMLQMTVSNCRPTLGNTREGLCSRMLAEVFDRIVPAGDITTIVLAGRWREEHLEGVKAAVDHITAHGLRAIVVGPGPEYLNDAPALMARALLRGDLDSMREHLLPERVSLQNAMAHHLRDTGATFIAQHDLLCPGTGCLLHTPSGAAMHYDTSHLTLAGTRHLVALMNTD